MSSPEPLLDGRVRLHVGDMAAVLATLPDCSVDSVVCDPPYHLTSIVKRFGGKGAAPAQHGTDGAFARASRGFMGQQWDGGDVAFRVETWAAVLRVLKPGGHLVAFSGTRTYHRMACAIEDAGFEIRDQPAWMYATGFPKSHDVAKGIDKLDSVTPPRERSLKFTAWMRSTGITSRTIAQATGSAMASHYLTNGEQPEVATRAMFELLRPHLPPVPDWVERLIDEREIERENLKRRPVLGVHEKTAHAAEWRAAYASGSIAEPGKITRAFSPEAAAWEGWGTAVKPAWEPIAFARKPLSEGSVAANVLKWGTGAINVDGCRIEWSGEADRLAGRPGSLSGPYDGLSGKAFKRGDRSHRDPADAQSEIGRFPANVLHDGSDEVVAAFPESESRGGTITRRSDFVGLAGNEGGAFVQRAGKSWDVSGDSGSAARFFFSAKADGDDRLGSKHPTVKPVDLMQWLVRLVTPRNGVVLDPFAGTGTTGEAAWREGFDAILVEREPAYAEDIRRRMALALAGPATRKAESVKSRGNAADAGPLFGLFTTDQPETQA